jgi:hypothetical protein
MPFQPDAPRDGADHRERESSNGWHHDKNPYESSRESEENTTNVL